MSYISFSRPLVFKYCVLNTYYVLALFQMFYMHKLYWPSQQSYEAGEGREINLKLNR